MLKAPVIAAAAIGGAVVAGAGALFIFSGPSAISLPKEAFDEDTVLACVFDMEQFDEDAVATVETTLTDFIADMEELTGDDMPDREKEEFDDAMDALGAAAEVIADHEIQAFAVTVSLDLDDLLRGEDPEDAGLRITMLIKAGSEPDLVELAKDLGDAFDEEPSSRDLEEMEDDVDLEDIGGGWYAIELSGREGRVFGLPSGDGDSESADRFNDALSKTAGGIFQLAMTPPDLTDLLDISQITDDAMRAYRQMPDQVQDVIKSFDDIEMISYAIDIGEGFGFREYLVFENTDDAKDMIEAIEAMREELPDMMEELADDANIDRDEMEKMQESMLAIMDLYEVSRSGNTVAIEMDEDNFDEMMDLIIEVLAPALASARDNARRYEERAYEESWNSRDVRDREYPSDRAEEAGDSRYDRPRYDRAERIYDEAEDAAEDAADAVRDSADAAAE